MSDVHDLVLSTLQAAGGTGLFVEELAHRLGIDYQIIATTIQHMVSEGLVMQEQDAEKPRYFVKATEEEVGQRQLSDLNGCPCFHCLRIERCGVRQPDSPVICRSLEEWMISSEPS
jgi:predicted transcriptional regulator